MYFFITILALSSLIVVKLWILHPPPLSTHATSVGNVEQSVVASSHSSRNRNGSFWHQQLRQPGKASANISKLAQVACSKSPFCCVNQASSSAPGFSAEISYCDLTNDTGERDTGLMNVGLANTALLAASMFLCRFLCLLALSYVCFIFFSIVSFLSFSTLFFFLPHARKPTLLHWTLLHH